MRQSTALHLGISCSILLAKVILNLRRLGWGPASRGHASSASSITATLLCTMMFMGLFARSATSQIVREDFPITNGYVWAAAVSGDRLYIGGAFTYVGPATGSAVPLETSQGLPLSRFPHVFGNVDVVAPDGNGGWYIGGNFYHVDTAYRYNLAHITADYQVSDWSPEVDGEVRALVVSGNTVYVGGSFTHIGGQIRNCIAAIDATTGAVTGWNPNASSTVSVLALSGQIVYAGGAFTSVGGQARNRIAAIDATTGAVTGWNPNASSTVSVLALSGQIVYAGGAFTSVGGQARNRIAAIDATTGAVTGWNPNANGDVTTLAIRAPSIYVGGSFTIIGGQIRNCIAAIDATTGAVTGWNPNASSTVSVLAVSEQTVYAGGAFTSVGGQARNRIAAIDATTGAVTAWNPNVSSTVSVLAVSGRVIYAGGAFTSIGGQTRNRIAAIDLATGTTTSWNPDANQEVGTVLIEGNTVYVGGSFNVIGGQTRNGMAAIDATTGSVTGWNPNANGGAACLVSDGNSIYAGGSFTSIGGQSRNFIAALDPATGAARAWNPNPNGYVEALALNGNTIYAGGGFTSVGGQARFPIAAIDLTTGMPTTWQVSGTPMSEFVRSIAVSPTTIYFADGSEWCAVDASTGVMLSQNYVCGYDVRDLVWSQGVLYVAGDLWDCASSGEPAGVLVWGAGGWNSHIRTDGVGCTVASDGRWVYVGGMFRAGDDYSRQNLVAVSSPTSSCGPSPDDCDGDGLLDDWETNGGIPMAGGGRFLLPDANVNHKDLYVEVDAMVGRVPQQAALADVVAAFAAVPNSLVDNPDGRDGINLHVTLDELDIPQVTWSDGFPVPPIVDECSSTAAAYPFYAVKCERFGTPADRSDPNHAAILQAKRMAYRYCVFADSYGGTTSSGQADDVPGRDFFVSLGAFVPRGGSVEDQAGTFMHELGHTMGLFHGGDQDNAFLPCRFNYKPNYYSVMNYMWQFRADRDMLTGLAGDALRNFSNSWRLDYSREPLNTLVEDALNETTGIGGDPALYVPVGPPPNAASQTAQAVRMGGPIDWDRDGVLNETNSDADVNYMPGNINGCGPSGHYTLSGFADWPNLHYAPGSLAKVGMLAGPIQEMTYDDVIALSTLRFDCNGNGIYDDEEIGDGLLRDLNDNAIPDTCEIDMVVAVEIQDLSAVVRDEGVFLSWTLASQAVSQVDDLRVQRAESPSGPYDELATLIPQPRMSFEDRTAVRAATYSYRLVLHHGDGRGSVAGPVTVAVGRRERAELKLTSGFALGPVEIVYRVPSPATRVKLVIYDLGGRQVRMLFDGVREQGEYLQTWDRLDESGQRVARGVYMGVLRLDGEQLSKKIVLVR